MVGEIPAPADAALVIVVEVPVESFEVADFDLVDEFEVILLLDLELIPIVFFLVAHTSWEVLVFEFSREDIGLLGLLLHDGLELF